MTLQEILRNKGRNDSLDFATGNFRRRGANARSPQRRFPGCL